mmetsp:Transcript_9793/g.26533  ORF Transcript_9793/g.26533 Transcript_9793/m.26533 type:complete len:213 (+) Transcript_9793:3391-4029(+)
MRQWMRWTHGVTLLKVTLSLQGTMKLRSTCVSRPKAKKSGPCWPKKTAVLHGRLKSPTLRPPKSHLPSCQAISAKLLTPLPLSWLRASSHLAAVLAADLAANLAADLAAAWTIRGRSYSSLCAKRHHRVEGPALVLPAPVPASAPVCPSHSRSSRPPSPLPASQAQQTPRPPCPRHLRGSRPPSPLPASQASQTPRPPRPPPLKASRSPSPI